MRLGDWDDRRSSLLHCSFHHLKKGRILTFPLSGKVVIKFRRLCVPELKNWMSKTGLATTPRYHSILTTFKT